jgi:putative membrane protein
MFAQRTAIGRGRFDHVEDGAERLTRGNMLGFLIRAAIVALGLWVATVWVSGVSIDSPSTLILAGVLLGIVNSIVRPIAIVLTLPMTIVTLGLFLLVINAGMVGLVAWMLPGMHVAGFWPAFWAAVVVSLVSMLGSAFIGPKGKFEVIVKRR